MLFLAFLEVVLVLFFVFLNIDVPFILIVINSNLYIRYIYLEDVMHFMSEEEALKTMGLFGVAAISKSLHRDWMV